MPKQSKLMNFSDKCIYCGAQVIVYDGVFVCVNQSCYKKIADDVLHWLKSIGYDRYFTEEFLFRLAQTGVVKNLIDLYKISLFQIADSLMEKTHSIISNKLYRTIQASVGNISINEFLVGLNIPYCDKKICAKLSKKINSSEDVLKVFGSKEATELLKNRQKDIVSWINNKSDFIEDLFLKVKPKVKHEKVKGKLFGTYIFITGILNYPREKFVEIIAQNEGIFSLKLIRKVKFMLVGINPDPKMLEKAKKYKTKTITEEEFWRMLE